MSRRIYADNAATSFPKPPAVLAAMIDYAERLGASAGRGAYRESLETARIVAACRQRLARLLNAEDPRRIVFTFNCTEALNLALRGWLRSGDHVVATRSEHNSVLRPLHDLTAMLGIHVTYTDVDRRTGRIAPDAVAHALRPQTRLIVVQHAGNVTGALHPIAEIGALARQRGIPLLVDAAQTVGHVPIDVRDMNIDLLAFPGHKGLLGPLGTGGLYIRTGMETELRPLVAGGTGSVSERPVQPDFMPDKYEAGSHNAIGLAGLAAALVWLLDEGVESIRRHEEAICRRFLARAADIDGLTVFGPHDPLHRVAVFSVRVAGLTTEALSAALENDFGILTRGGLHCAPWAHAALGTDADGGTTRLSFGPFNSLDDVDASLDALASLTRGALELSTSERR
jgi:cysteine desulfurase/selenocysteine lyase